MPSEKYLPDGTPRKRAAIYMRYSSNMQRPASLEDQERNCRKCADDNGWLVADRYVRGDAAKIGRTMQNRPALDFLIHAAQEKNPPFDVLIVDEQSRLGRNLKDILELSAILKHCRIKLYIVARKLDSDDSNFQTILTITGMVDEQNSEQMRHRVLRGQEGRVLQGMASGSRCFGYRSVPVVDQDHPELQGRAGILGHRWNVVDTEAATIRRIYELYANGLSDFQIMKKFNDEKVAAARKPRIGPDHTVWNPNIIKRILQNEKYIGKQVWNRTTQLIHPVTGKTETRKNPSEKWVTIDNPSLRIVSDELWASVQARLTVVNQKMTRRRMGGLNRAKKRDYLFSGLLICGECGSSITIGGVTGRAAIYGCVSSRYKRGCTNNLWIREDRLAGQLIQALQKNLLVPEVMDYFTAAVSRELELYRKNGTLDQQSSSDSLRAQEVSLKSMVSRLLDAIMNPTSADSTALPAKLAEIEDKLAQVRNDLRLLNAPKNASGDDADVAAMVRKSVARLEDVMKTDVAKARQILQMHINKLALFPVLTEGGRGYEVVGDIDLFRSPEDPDGRILLARSGTGTVQQYTESPDLIFHFADLFIDCDVDPEPNPLIALLEDLLTFRPELLHEPKTAKDWAILIRELLEQDSPVFSRMTDAFVSWTLEYRTEVFIDHFGMVRFDFGRQHFYLFTKMSPEPREETKTLISDTNGKN